ncbi:hypothetical protein NL676_004811 [Syzygium grande]|nr:hypothetical protein NL676_004811 [Syzygium grande]
MAHSWLSLIISFMLSTATIYGQKLYTPTLSLHRKHVLRDPGRALSAYVTNDFETFFFNQTLDHFNYRLESYTTFKQRYLINSNFWGGANSSVPIFVYLGAEEPIDGSPTDPRHRYYGESIPLGMSFEEALKDANVRGYFNSAQALADYATIIMHVKEERNASKSPVIVVGGSYGGSKCDGPLRSGDELKNYLISMYIGAAQYDDPPIFPVTRICNGIDGANTTENGILGKIFAGVVAYERDSTCYFNSPTNVSETSLGWGWQVCSEMVFPIGITDNPMFQPAPFNLSRFIDDCNHEYGVAPCPY